MGIRFSNEELKKIHKIQLAMLVELDRICRKYDIKYIISGGTLLGAVRANSFIPWDDDIDVAMPRGDYERFLKYTVGKTLENIEKIREYLSKNNISKTSDIAEYIGLSLPRTRAILKEIPDVSPIGNNSNRKWTLQK